MASSKKQNLVPDEAIMSSIFPASFKIKPSDCNIIYNDYDTCTFSVHLDSVPWVFEDLKDYLVRIEASRGRLALIADLQYLAHSQLPELVPQVLKTDQTATADGRPLEYLLATYYIGTTTLEDVWDTLDGKQQAGLVDSLQHPSAPKDFATYIGGPDLGYYPNIKQYLRAVLQANTPKQPTCGLLETPNGNTLIKSIFDDIGQVEFTPSDLATLSQHIVLSHNDLEPRNILVRKKTVAPTNTTISTTTTTEDTTTNTSPQYELAAIIDWEAAGFYPLAHEPGLKHCQLGLNNLSWTWYELFKQRTGHMLPQGEECHDKSMGALWVIDESRKRVMTRNVGVRVQKRWIERHGLERGADVRMGWLRRAGGEGLGVLRKKEVEALEMEVIRELGLVEVDGRWM